jgi:hypothetical protein
MIEKINLLLRNNNIDIELKENIFINSFEMDEKYFLDVFWTRYEVSLDLNRPINGLKEVLEKVERLKVEKIISTSIEIDGTEIIIYTDKYFLEYYGLIKF